MSIPRGAAWFLTRCANQFLAGTGEINEIERSRVGQVESQEFTVGEDVMR